MPSLFLEQPVTTFALRMCSARPDVQKQTQEDVNFAHVGLVGIFAICFSNVFAVNWQIFFEKDHKVMERKHACTSPLFKFLCIFTGMFHPGGYVGMPKGNSVLFEVKAVLQKVSGQRA